MAEEARGGAGRFGTRLKKTKHAGGVVIHESLSMEAVEQRRRSQ